MFLEGQIIEFLDGGHLKPGFVRKQERDRLQVIDPRGRQSSVNRDHVAVVHSAVSEDEFPAVIRDILARIESRQSEVDVELLWESLGAAGGDFPVEELARLFFAESTAESTSALFHALMQDTLFFKRNGLRFVARTADQVATERTRRKRQQEREDSRGKLADSVRELLDTETQLRAELEPVIDRIHSWLRYKTGDEVEAVLSQIVGNSHSRDAAYDILVRNGRVSPTADRFLVMAGIDEKFDISEIDAAALLDGATHTEDRVDLREYHALSIDDADTVEIDDAFTVRYQDGKHIVGIHIADVSAFVRRGDALDALALKRASTIYLPGVSVRMLPDRLSTDLASLRQGEDRPVFTVEAVFDSEMNLIAHNLFPSTIRVRERLTYEEADHRILKGDAALSTLHKIGLRLQASRSEHGAVTFRRPEIKVRVHHNSEGESIEVRSLDPNSASRVLVSELMILLNGLAADFAAVHNLPVIFRTQEPRDPLPPEAASLPDALQFDKLRRTFKRSRLSLTPGLHSGLGLSAYTQVSSPIRRYADLVTQRQFTAFLRKQPVPHERDELLQVLASAEAAEQEIRTIEERSTTYWLLKYLAREKIGTVLDAIILDKKGNVELDGFFVRGKLADPGNASPGTILQVTLAQIDPLTGDIRLKRA